MNKSLTKRPLFNVIVTAFAVYAFLEILAHLIFLWNNPLAFPSLRQGRITMVGLHTLFLLLLGLIYRYRMPAIKRIGLSIASILVVFVGLEAILRTGYFDNSASDEPIWTPPYLVEEDRRINERNDVEMARFNRYGFTDVAHPYVLAPGHRRLMILGDSFVWGDGLPWQQTWGHKLKRRIAELSTQIDVMVCGRRGFQTWDEYTFLKNEGIKYRPDLILIGFVTNDFSLWRFHDDHMAWQEYESFQWIGKILPYSWTFFTVHLNNVIDKRIRQPLGYVEWSERIVQPENLAQYDKFMGEFAVFCREQNLKVVFVFTGTSGSPGEQEIYDKAARIFDAHGLAYIDLLPSVRKLTQGHYQKRFWANPANSHPGDALTTVYAEQTLRALEERGYL